MNNAYFIGTYVLSIIVSYFLWYKTTYIKENKLGTLIILCIVPGLSFMFMLLSVLIMFIDHKRKKSALDLMPITILFNRKL